MSSERDKSSENPYKATHPMSEPQPETPPPEQRWVWELATSVTLLLLVVFMSAWWFREFGGVGLTMLIGGFTGSYCGWQISMERWWGLAGGAVIGFITGAALGIVWLFNS